MKSFAVRAAMGQCVVHPLQHAAIHLARGILPWPKVQNAC
jgi:hypothetical protein